MSQRQQQLEWRRAKVLELSSQGYTQIEIGQKLQIDRVTVHRDLVYLRQQAQENLQKHIHEVVPEEYQKCMVGMKRNLKQTLEIAETATDPKIKLQARAIANDCYKFIMDMSTNAGIVSDALKFVNQSEKKINGLQKQTETEEQEAEEETTTSGVY
jgi:DNA-binding transcriptional regulator LsrR (DeoR family)